MANALEPILAQWVEEHKPFATVKEMYDAAVAALDAPKADVAPAELVFDPGTWEGDEKLSKNNLKAKGFVKGKSLRDDQGMDYKTVDKDAYEVVGRPDLALIIREGRPPGAGTLSDEIATLRALSARLPTAEIVDAGFYPDGEDAQPALLMRRYESSSKTLIRRVKKAIRRNDEWLHNIRFLNTPAKIKTALGSLALIRSHIQSNAGDAVDDIQFLIAGDGTFVINDASQTGAKFQEANVEVISALIQLVEEWAARLPAPPPALNAPAPSPLATATRAAANRRTNRERSQGGFIALGGGLFLPDFRTVDGVGFEEEGTVTDFLDAGEVDEENDS